MIQNKGVTFEANSIIGSVIAEQSGIRFLIKLMVPRNAQIFSRFMDSDGLNIASF